VISSIELVGIIHGPEVGRRAWALYRRLHGCAIVILKLTAKGPLAGRSLRKREELRSTRSGAVSLLEEDTPHYPLVKFLARESHL
jgi:hypothetical protein